MDMRVKGFTINWPDDIEASEEVQRASALLAVDSLRSLTANRVGGSLVTVMPRTCGNYERVNPLIGGYPFVPYMGHDGGIYNCACGGGCSCDSRPWVMLPDPVGYIEAVTVNGEVLDPSAYQVEQGNRLVRLDGEAWPACAGENFTVTYLNAYAVDEVGNMAATILAKEFLAALDPGQKRKCRLPSNVTALTRQGVSMELSTGLFPGGMTGIKEVDAFIRLWNPNNLIIPPTVHSPDWRKRSRMVTWRA